MRNEEKLVGMDWANDALFFTHTWADETSEFDDHPSKYWSGGNDCYKRTYKARVPIAFQNCPEMIERFLLSMEDLPDTEGFWV